MSVKEVKTSERSRHLGRMWGRLGLLLLAALAVGWLLNRTAEACRGEDARPAGFGPGFIQGVLMPMALPHFILGRDIQIYSANNTGIPYKLGYTSGVNACGAVFFGFLFWRLNRVRRLFGRCQPDPPQSHRPCGTSHAEQSNLDETSKGSNE